MCRFREARVCDALQLHRCGVHFAGIAAVTDGKTASEKISVKKYTKAIYFQVKGSKYIITHAFTKKTQKTPENEKQIARNRRSQYLTKEENQ